jgi:hypothetical protein
MTLRKYYDDEDLTMTTKFLRRSTRILVLNPNSSESMTHGVEEAIRTLHLSPVSANNTVPNCHPDLKYVVHD